MYFFKLKNLKSWIYSASTIVCLSFFWISPGYIIAQQSDTLKAKHYAAIQVGINQIKEENLHPKVSSGILSQITYGFEKESKNLKQFNLILGFSRLKTNLEDVSKTVNLRIKSNYSLNFSLIKNKSLTYLLGPEAILDYNASYFPNWDDSHLYWADYLSIGVRNILIVNLKNNRKWHTSLSLPLFSVFSRPELYRLYKIDDTNAGGILSALHSNISPAHLTNVFHVQLQTEYRFPAFTKTQEALYYSFEWVRVHNDDSLPFQKMIHQIGIKFFL